jgi:hypothetical protein
MQQSLPDLSYQNPQVDSATVGEKPNPLPAPGETNPDDWKILATAFPDINYVEVKADDAVESDRVIVEQKPITAPDIPFSRGDAFYPLRRDEQGNIYPSYQYRVCVKKFIGCLKWAPKRIYFKDLEWFFANGFGLYKRKGIGR